MSASEYFTDVELVGDLRARFRWAVRGGNVKWLLTDSERTVLAAQSRAEAAAAVRKLRNHEERGRDLQAAESKEPGAGSKDRRDSVPEENQARTSEGGEGQTQ
jgi:hypothetical protein